MKLKVTPTTDGKLQSEFTTLRNPRTGKPAKLSVADALYWGNRAVQVNEAQGGDQDFTVKIEGDD